MSLGTSPKDRGGVGHQGGSQSSSSTRALTRFTSRPRLSVEVTRGVTVARSNSFEQHVQSEAAVFKISIECPVLQERIS